MEKDISITSDPMDGFQSVRGHFWVVFQGHPHGEVTVNISLISRPPCVVCVEQDRATLESSLILNVIL